jgi:hypothetical protein
MNAKQAYLAWLRQTAPATYATAMQKIARKPRSLGGLNRNLVSSMYSPSTGFGFLSDSTDTLSPVDITAPDLSSLTVDTSSFQQPDLSSLMVDTSTFSSPDFSSSIPDFSTSTPDTSGSSGGSSWFNSNTFSSLINAVGNVASTALNVNAQSNLLNLNTARASQGLWPVQQNGQPIPQSQLYPAASPSLARFESAISTQGMTTPLLLVAGLGLLAFAFFKRRR